MGEVVEGLVTVIIPVYNCAAYVVDTLDSLLSQTYSNFEVVMVDDGSTDGSGDICRRYAAKYESFTYVWQDNAGAGAARNHGIDLARGEYLFFADADDLFEDSLISKLCALIAQQDSDVAICRCDAFKCSYSEDTALEYGAHVETRTVAPADIADRFFQSFDRVPWNKLFRTQHVKDKGIFYQTLPYSNDNYFVLMALLLANRIACTDSVLVHHRLGTGKSLRDKMYLSPTCDLEMLDFLRDAIFALGDVRWSSFEVSLDSFTVDCAFRSYVMLAMQSETACIDFWKHFTYLSLPEWERLKGGPLKVDGFACTIRFDLLKRCEPRGMIWAYSCYGDNARALSSKQNRIAMLRAFVSPLIVGNQHGLSANNA